MDSSSNSAGNMLQKSFFDYLKNKKLRNTAEREAIFSIVCQTKDPFTLEMIGQQLESNFPVSRASIYNTIELLLDAKIVVRHQFANTNLQYELKYIADQYNHVICTYCGSVRKIKNDRNMEKRFLVSYEIYCGKSLYLQVSFYLQTISGIHLIIV